MPCLWPLGRGRARTTNGQGGRGKRRKEDGQEEERSKGRDEKGGVRVRRGQRKTWGWIREN